MIALRGLKNGGLMERINVETMPGVMAVIKENAAKKQLHRKIYRITLLCCRENPNYKLGGVFREVAQGVGLSWTTVRRIYYVYANKKVVKA